MPNHSLQPIGTPVPETDLLQIAEITQTDIDLAIAESTHDQRKLIGAKVNLSQVTTALRRLLQL